MGAQDIEALAAEVADLIIKSKKLVVFTGAGISTESGIPDFRSPGGIWDRFDPDDFTYSKFVSSEDSRRKQWYIFREGLLSIKPCPIPLISPSSICTEWAGWIALSRRISITCTRKQACRAIWCLSFTVI